MAAFPADAGDNNRVFSPCTDTQVQRSDGFTFGIVFAPKDKFFLNNNSSVQLSPCDTRLSLSNSNYQISVFRPKVDEISLLTVNSSSFTAVRSRFLCFVFSIWILEIGIVSVVGNRSNRSQFLLLIHNLVNLYFFFNSCLLLQNVALNYDNMF